MALYWSADKLIRILSKIMDNRKGFNTVWNQNVSGNKKIQHWNRQTSRILHRYESDGRWTSLNETFFLFQLMHAQEKRLRFYETRSHAIILYDTACRMHSESDMHEN